MRADVTIRPIREDEMAPLWELRLRALRDHPEAFGADYGEWRARGPEPFRQRVFGTPGTVVFGAFDADGTLVAMTGVSPETGKRAHIAYVWGVYTAPEARGQGISRRLIDAALGHCRTCPGIRQAHISVNADNATARRVYETAGFVAWGREPRAIALPGRFDDEIHMAIMLDGDMSS